MNKLEAIINKIPHYYASKEDTDSELYGLFKAFADELEIIFDQINRADDMIGVDTTRGEDLYYRWGSILGLPRRSGESDNDYRLRLKVSIQTLVGGTKIAIRYALAVMLGINGKPTEMENRIKVYDAWDFTEVAIPDEFKTPAHIVVVIDMQNTYYSSTLGQQTITTITDTKAAGIMIFPLYKNIKVEYYYQLDELHYADLDLTTYSNLG